jgi:pyruvate,water dikinase
MLFRINDISEKPSPKLIGGKGVQLANLTRLQLPVPEWFCISTSVFEQFLQDIPSLKQNDNERYQQIIDTPLQRNIQLALENAIADLLQSSASNALSVRSSATVEDSIAASHAGQFDTFLGVTDVKTAILNVKQCWASLWSERAEKYRDQQNDATQASMAVIIQEFLPADISGVMFTSNPVTQKQAECVIEASWGLGELIVSGQVVPDHFVIDTGQGKTSEFEVLTKKLGSKHEALFWNAKRKKLGKKQNFRYFQQNFVLDESQLFRLTKQGLELQAQLGCPQDIEWAMYQDKIYILQSRPITSV